jgi:hypothetical protein
MSSTSATTGTNTGNAGGGVNNVAPVVDSLGVHPSVVDVGDTVDVDGTGFDDNGQEDVAGVTVKVTAPGGATSFPSTVFAATSATDVAFHATHAVAGDAEPGTYQVDSFIADTSGAQSDVVSVVFTVLAPATESVDVSYTGSAQRLEFGGFNPGATQVESQNAFGVSNHVGHAAHFWFDMTDFTCSRGVVPVMGNAKVILGSLSGGVFTPASTQDYSESVVDFGTINDGGSLYVKVQLDQVPRAVAGSCTASFGLYHT